MTDREKLIALLEDAEYQCDNRDCEEDAKGCEYLCYHNCWAQFFADHLIANGVVVREKGEWIDIYGGKYDNPRYSCSHCGEKALYKFEVDVLGHEKTVQALTDSCPNCGSDMRKGENDA